MLTKCLNSPLDRNELLAAGMLSSPSPLANLRFADTQDSDEQAVQELQFLADQFFLSDEQAVFVHGTHMVEVEE